MDAVSSSLPIYLYETSYKYRDETHAVHPLCIQDMKHCLKELGVDSARIVRVLDNSSLRKIQNAGVLMMPGGNAYALMLDLEGSENHIRAQVRNGLHYFGSCAGGIVAGNSLGGDEFSKQNFLLNLLPLHSNHNMIERIRGIFAITQKSDMQLPLRSECETPSFFSATWNNGCNLQIYNSLTQKINIEAYYQGYRDNPIAAVTGNYQKGTVVSCQFHFETDFKDDGSSRADFARRIFTKVGIL